MAKKINRRATVNLGDLEISEEELMELLGIEDRDTWDAMPDAQKLLVLARRGIKATREGLDKGGQ